MCDLLRIRGREPTPPALIVEKREEIASTSRKKGPKTRNSRWTLAQPGQERDPVAPTGMLEIYF